MHTDGALPDTSLCWHPVSTVLAEQLHSTCSVTQHTRTVNQEAATCVLVTPAHFYQNCEAASADVRSSGVAPSGTSAAGMPSIMATLGAEMVV